MTSPRSRNTRPASGLTPGVDIPQSWTSLNGEAGRASVATHALTLPIAVHAAEANPPISAEIVPAPAEGGVPHPIPGETSGASLTWRGRA